MRVMLIEASPRFITDSLLNYTHCRRSYPLEPMRMLDAQRWKSFFQFLPYVLIPCVTYPARLESGIDGRGLTGVRSDTIMVSI